MNPNSPLAQNYDISAQAGIWQEQNLDFIQLRMGFSNHLDSRLRGNDGLMDYLG